MKQNNKVEGWEERLELAKHRCAEIIDLDQNPPVKYTAVYCKSALQELRELDDLHKKLILKAEENGYQRALGLIKKPRPQINGLYKREKKILDIYENYKKEVGVYPSYRVAAKIYQSTHHNVEVAVKNLIKKGYLNSLTHT